MNTAHDSQQQAPSPVTPSAEALSLLQQAMDVCTEHGGLVPQGGSAGGVTDADVSLIREAASSLEDCANFLDQRLHHEWAARCSRISGRLKSFAASRLGAATPTMTACGDSGDAADARRYRWLRDLRCNSVTLDRNGAHACNYMTASEWIEENPEAYVDADPAEIQRMKDTDTIWCLQVYPHTPIGFNWWHASTLDAVIDAAIAASPSHGTGAV